MPTQPPETPKLTPSALADFPLTEETCDRLAQGEVPAEYSEAICGREGHGCMNHTCALMPIPIRFECLKCILEEEAIEKAEKEVRTPTLTFTFTDHTLLTAQWARSRKPSEWRELAEKYESLGLGLCASICISKRRKEIRRRKKKREAQLEKDALGDMFSDGIDDGFTGITSSD